MRKRNLSLKQYKEIAFLIGTVIMIFLTIAGYRRGIFTSQDKMQSFLGACGILAPVLFVLLQAMQVVVPILPGAVGCVYGVLFWGAVKGFLLNYTGICIGSLWAFLLARHFGRQLVVQMTGNRFYTKYHKYLLQEKQFERIFALLIFLPVAPDDFLCYLAGISNMSVRKFMAIILLGKPAAIFLYSVGLHQILQMVVGLLP